MDEKYYEEADKRNKSLIAGFVVVSIFFISVIILCIMWYQDNVQSCTKEPFVYGSKELEKEYGADFFGNIYARTDKGIFPFLSFNSTNTYKE